MQNVEKWPNFKIFKEVWPVFNIMHESVDVE